MKLTEVLQGQRYVFHSTGYAGAAKILQSGMIKGLFVNMSPEEREELEREVAVGYGDVVYTTTFDQKPYTFMGVGGDEVIFVIDVKKAPEGKYEDAENGLYMIPHSVPLSAIPLMYISGDDDEAQMKVYELAEKRDIEAILEVEEMTVSKEKFIDNIKRFGV